MIDHDLAVLFAVETKAINQAARETCHAFQLNFVSS